MKKIVLVYYSQTGQLTHVLTSFIKGLESVSEIEAQLHRVIPKEEFPFPWSIKDFFNAMPETVMMQPIPLEKTEWVGIEADFVVLAYQPWYLTPSRPISTLLQDPLFLEFLKGKQVLTLITCRNMWLRSQEIVKKKLLDADAKLIANIVLSDASSNLVSLVTTLRWMIGGKKNSFWIFPEAGINKTQFHRVESWGKTIADYLLNDKVSSLQEQLRAAGSVHVNANLIALESRGAKAYPIWAKFISGAGDKNSPSRIVRVYLLAFLLPTAVFILSPIMTLTTLIFKILNRKSLKEKVKYFEGVSYKEGLF